MRNSNDLAKKALKEWESTETFPVSDVEAHGFINGFNWAYRQFKAEIEKLQERKANE